MPDTAAPKQVDRVQHGEEAGQGKRHGDRQYPDHSHSGEAPRVLAEQRFRTEERRGCQQLYGSTSASCFPLRKGSTSLQPFRDKMRAHAERVAASRRGFRCTKSAILQLTRAGTLDEAGRRHSGRTWEYPPGGFARARANPRRKPDYCLAGAACAGSAFGGAALFRRRGRTSVRFRSATWGRTASPASMVTKPLATR